MSADNPPVDCYLVMRRDLAERLIGFKKEGQFSISHKPFFSFEIVHIFRKIDFIPMATMDTVLLHFTLKKDSLLTAQDKKQYIMLVGQGFGGGKRLRYNLRSFLSPDQFQKIASKSKFSPKPNIFSSVKPDLILLNDGSSKLIKRKL